MQYDQSWMGYGMVGGLQAGAISAGAGFLLFLLLYWLRRHHGWSDVRQMCCAYGLALLLTASGDLWDLLYFNYSGGLQSIALLRAKLAAVHDPDSIGTRVFWELIGAAVGVYIAWVVSKGDWYRRSTKNQ